MARFSTANSCPLDRRTMAAGTSMRCLFGNVTVSERVSPGRMGKSPEGQRNIYYFTPKIRVPLRVTQAEAKRANAKE